MLGKAKAKRVTVRVDEDSRVDCSVVECKSVHSNKQVDINRTLALLLKYSDNDEFNRIDGLIEKWRNAILSIIDALFAESHLSVDKSVFIKSLHLPDDILEENSCTEDTSDE